MGGITKQRFNKQREFILDVGRPPQYKDEKFSAQTSDNLNDK